MTGVQTCALPISLLRADDLGDRLRASLPRVLRRQRERTAGLTQRFDARSPLELIRATLLRLSQSRERLVQQIRRQEQAHRTRLEHRLAHLNSLSPLAILSRGYSVARRLSDGLILRSAAAVAPGERVVILLHEGEMQATVDEVRRQRSWPKPESA